MPRTITQFMKQEFGEKGITLLNSILSRLHVDDIMEASIDTKKHFIIEIQPELKALSFSKANVLISELISILEIKVKGYNEGTESAEVVQDFILEFVQKKGHQKLDMISSKIDAVYELFWQNATKAFEQGVSINSINTTTNHILAMLKEDLQNITAEIEQKYNLNVTNRGMFSKYNKNQNPNYSESVRSKFSFVRKKTPVEETFLFFNDKIDDAYKEFYNVFITSMNEEIKLNMNKVNDRKLKKETQVKTDEAWNKIVKAYKFLETRLEYIKQFPNEYR